MPPKRRTTKRRLDIAGEIEAWTDVFLFGADFSGALAQAGVPIASWRPAPAMLEEAWRRLGEPFLTKWGGPDEQDIWALRELGVPHAR